VAAEASLPYEDWLIARLKDPAEAAAYLEAAIEQSDQPALMLALRHVAMAQGGIAEIARRAKLTREAAYRMLSNSGNPELRSLVAILGAAGLKLSIRPMDAGSKVAEKRAAYRVQRQKRSPAAPNRKLVAALRDYRERTLDAENPIDLRPRPKRR
jgi:probable addiction module antidote protein